MNISQSLTGLHYNQQSIKLDDANKLDTENLEISASGELQGSFEIAGEQPIFASSDELYDVAANSSVPQGMDDKTAMQKLFGLNDKQYEEYAELKAQQTKFYRIEENRTLTANEQSQWKNVNDRISNILSAAAGGGGRLLGRV